ncbi:MULTISPECIES: lipopolysaccharide biosynthesis protein [unclassified Desulfovibrio]|uniref:lipopolysaccharide biosynthesis protein n=1 Tax=unclassified Desulfovibrio TaxID=2593640 RepID=UPI002FD9E33E
MQSSTPTLARRYTFKLLANIATVPVYLVMEAILPRALGPQMYGNYSFATNLFQQLTGFLDMGTSTCFYNALSRRQNETGLATFYARVTVLVMGIILLAALALQAPLLGDLLMPDVPLWLAPLAALWAFLTWWGRVLRSMNDAVGATVASEMVRTVVSLFMVALLGLMFWQDWLNIHTLFAQQYLMLGLMALGYWLVTRRHWRSRDVAVRFRLPAGQGKAYSREFFTYSHPLFVQALLSFLLLTAERWLLQWFDGSVQQGFFALSQKVSMACFLFVSAMTPLIMRELSIAWGHNDREAMGRLLTRFAPLLYVVAAYFSCFTLMEGSALVDFFGGAEFAAATLPVQIMALYPLHQAYGQLAGSVFHATGRTRVLRNMAALECVYGFTAAWFLLAPPEYMGLNLGAVGLALKTVAVQIITVNVYLWLASRFLPLSFWRNVAHQIWSLAVLLGLAWLCREGTLMAGLGDMDTFSRFFISGVLYSVGTVLLCLSLPALLGLSRQDLRELVARFKKSRQKTA